MAASPIRPWLYRRASRAVICALLAASVAQSAHAQLGRKAKQAGPRALGLLELAPDGSAHLIPIAILVDGKFYDASAYKASPVPFAIWGETVYEAERTGVPQGLFTVGEVLHTGTSWLAEGKWRPAGSEPAKKHHDESKPKMDEDEGPPKLRRPEAEKSKTPAPPIPAASPEAKAPPAAASPNDTKPTSEPPDTAKPKVDASPDSGLGDAYNTAANDTDPNRPVLQRGKTHAVGPAPGQASVLKATGTTAKTPAAKTEKKNAQPQLIPAISDAGGPDPRPYSYDIKPDEEQNFRKKMLVLATDAVQARVKETTPVVPGAKPAVRPSASARGAAKAPQLSFDDVQFRAFDLWNTNEPVFVLSAKARMPGSSKSAESDNDVMYFVTLVEKVDIYGDLRKLNATVTDTRHLDQIPRLELIDAVDADGDGRGELLFRQVSDTGSAWAIYRAGADQLFPLFQGTL
jgi:hypothetical protein